MNTLRNTTIQRPTLQTPQPAPTLLTARHGMALNRQPTLRKSLYGLTRLRAFRKLRRTLRATSSAQLQSSTLTTRFGALTTQPASRLRRMHSLALLRALSLRLNSYSTSSSEATPSRFLPTKKTAARVSSKSRATRATRTLFSRSYRYLYLTMTKARFLLIPQSTTQRQEVRQQRSLLSPNRSSRFLILSAKSRLSTFSPFFRHSHTSFPQTVSRPF